MNFVRSPIRREHPMLFRWPSAALARARSISVVAAAALAIASVPAASQGAAEPLPAETSPDAGANAGAPALAPEEGSAVARLIAANLGNLKQITPELIALISADPALAAGLIEAAKSSPAQAAALAEILSSIQTQLSETNPDGAKIV